MKRSLFIAYVSLLGMLAVVPAFAQQKIGYIDSEYILSKIPEYSNLSERLNVFVQQWKMEMDEMNKQITDLKTDYEAKEILFTDEVKKQKVTEIETLEKQLATIENAKYGPQGEYFKKQKDLLEPLQQRILDATNTVAARDNYDYIFDRSGDYIFLYTRSEWNVSDDVLFELGIDVDDTSN